MVSRNTCFKLRHKLRVPQNVKVIIINVTQAIGHDFLYSSPLIGRCQTESLFQTRLRRLITSVATENKEDRWKESLFIQAIDNLEATWCVQRSTRTTFDGAASSYFSSLIFKPSRFRIRSS